MSPLVLGPQAESVTGVGGPTDTVLVPVHTSNLPLVPSPTEIPRRLPVLSGPDREWRHPDSDLHAPKTGSQD